MLSTAQIQKPLKCKNCGLSLYRVYKNGFNVTTSPPLHSVVCKTQTLFVKRNTPLLPSLGVCAQVGTISATVVVKNLLSGSRGWTSFLCVISDIHIINPTTAFEIVPPKWDISRVLISTSPTRGEVYSFLDCLKYLFYRKTKFSATIVAILIYPIIWELVTSKLMHVTRLWPKSSSVLAKSVFNLTELQSSRL